MAFAPAMMAASLLTTGVSTAMSVGQAKKDAKTQQRIAEINADRQRQVGSANVSLERREAQRRNAAQIAQINALGAPLGAGTSLDFASEAGAAAWFDEATIASQSDADATAYVNKGRQARAQSNARATNAFFGGASRLISGGTKLWSSLQSSAPTAP